MKVFQKGDKFTGRIFLDRNQYLKRRLEGVKRQINQVLHFLSRNHKFSVALGYLPRCLWQGEVKPIYFVWWQTQAIDDLEFPVKEDGEERKNCTLFTPGIGRREFEVVDRITQVIKEKEMENPFWLGLQTFFKPEIVYRWLILCSLFILSLQFDYRSHKIAYFSEKLKIKTN